MPVIAAAVCPHPPLLVPEVAAGAASELDDLRAACLAAIEHLSAADHLVVVHEGTGILRKQGFGGSTAKE